MKTTTNKLRVRARRVKRNFRTLTIQIHTTMSFILGGTVITGLLIGSGIV